MEAVGGSVADQALGPGSCGLAPAGGNDGGWLDRAPAGGSSAEKTAGAGRAGKAPAAGLLMSDPLSRMGVWKPLGDSPQTGP
jgi:hypothetical protein